MNSTLESADDAENVGFTCANNSCVNILSDLMKKYFDLLCRDAKSVAEHASRSQLNISDVNQAFRNRHIKLQELHDYLKQVQSFPPQKPVPLFPLSKSEHDIRGPISKRELVQRLEDDFPVFLPAIHREWIEEEQPRPKPTASTSKASEPQPSTSQQQIDIIIEDTSIRESSQGLKASFRKGSRVRPTTFPTFLGKTVKELGFHIRPQQPPKNVSPPPVVEEKEIPVENIPKIEIPVEKFEKNDVIIDIKPLTQDYVLTEKQPKEHKKEKSKKKKKDKDKDRERERGKKNERNGQRASQEAKVSSTTGPRYAAADATTISSTVLDSGMPDLRSNAPGTSEKTQPVLPWVADISTDLAPNSMPDQAPFLLPESNEDSNTQPFVQGVPLSTNESLPTSFPPGLTMENDGAVQDEFQNSIETSNSQVEESLPSIPTNESVKLPQISLDMLQIKSTTTSQKSPIKEKKKKKERRSHEEKEQRRKEKKRKRLEESFTPTLPTIALTETYQKHNNEPPKSIIEPIQIVKSKIVEEPLKTPPVVVELEKFEHPLVPQHIESIEKKKEKKKKKEKTEEERKKKKEERKRKHHKDDDMNSHLHKKKKRKHDHDEPHIDETLKVPILKIKFKPLGPSPSTSLVNTPQQSPVRKSAEQVVAPLKIPRTQPVPSSEQVQTQSEVAQQKVPKLEVKSEIPERPASETKKWSFFGCKTPDVPKPEIKVPTLKRKSSEEKIETPRETITPTNNISINNETIIPPKLTSDSKKKEKTNSLPKNNLPEMNKVERPSAVGLPPSASLKVASKNGKPRTEKISTHIKKKNAKFIKQDSADKGISTDKPKKEKKKLPKTDMNFLFSDTIKPKKPLAPPHAEPGEEEDDKVWICPVCSVAYVEGADMVACDGCDNWFHWICVGLISAPPENEPWYCPTCVRKRKKEQEKKEKGGSGFVVKLGSKEKKKKI
uniref:PHD-type domain-containing protein n=1 Tax=Acrobeloides nanus TaxID=290746 RepID=A0A914EBP8_9BILA